MPVPKWKGACGRHDSRRRSRAPRDCARPVPPHGQDGLPLRAEACTLPVTPKQAQQPPPRSFALQATSPWNFHTCSRLTQKEAGNRRHPWEREEKEGSSCPDWRGKAHLPGSHVMPINPATGHCPLCSPQPPEEHVPYLAQMCPLSSPAPCSSPPDVHPFPRHERCLVWVRPNRKCLLYRTPRDSAGRGMGPEGGGATSVPTSRHRTARETMPTSAR